MHIVLTFDDAMVGPAAVCLTSISMQRGADEVTAHLLHAGVASSRLEELVRHCTQIGLTTKLHRVDPTELIPLHAGLAHHPLPVSVLFRCILARYVPQDIDRVLYLDCDTVILGSLREFFQTELGDAIAAVCPNSFSALEHLGIPHGEYFNAGLLLIDMKRWRAENVEREVLDVLRRHASEIMYMDQCVLNIALRGRLAFVDHKYNYIYDMNQRRSDFRMPVIIHYAGAIKPWKQPYNHPWSGAYIEIAGLTPWPVSAQQLTEWNVPRLRAWRRRFLKAVGLRKR